MSDITPKKFCKLLHSFFYFGGHTPALTCTSPRRAAADFVSLISSSFSSASEVHYYFSFGSLDNVETRERSGETLFTL